MDHCFGSCCCLKQLLHHFRRPILRINKFFAGRPQCANRAYTSLSRECGQIQSSCCLSAILIRECKATTNSPLWPWSCSLHSVKRTPKMSARDCAFSSELTQNLPLTPPVSGKPSCKAPQTTLIAPPVKLYQVLPESCIIPYWDRASQDGYSIRLAFFTPHLPFFSLLADSYPEYYPNSIRIIISFTWRPCFPK